MRQHSVLDILTLWGGISIFTLVVAYIITKRSLYFVPEFAKAPFRSSPKCAPCPCPSSQQPDCRDTDFIIALTCSRPGVLDFSCGPDSSLKLTTACT